MRLLMKIPVPPPADNRIGAEPLFKEKLKSLFSAIGALAGHSNNTGGRRLEYVSEDIRPAQIPATAQQVFQFLRVKPESLPEVIPQPPTARMGY